MRRLGIARIVPAAIGVVVGELTVAGTYALYPPARNEVWEIAAVAAASIGAVLVFYLTTLRLGAIRVGDWLVLGYAGALVLAASLVVAREMAVAIRERVPESLGVKSSAGAPVERRGGSRVVEVVRSCAGSNSASCAWVARSEVRLIPPWVTRSASSS